MSLKIQRRIVFLALPFSANLSQSLSLSMSQVSHLQKHFSSQLLYWSLGSGQNPDPLWRKQLHKLHQWNLVYPLQINMHTNALELWHIFLHIAPYYCMSESSHYVTRPISSQIPIFLCVPAEAGTARNSLQDSAPCLQVLSQHHHKFCRTTQTLWLTGSITYISGAPPPQPHFLNPKISSNLSSEGNVTQASNRRAVICKPWRLDVAVVLSLATSCL